MPGWNAFSLPFDGEDGVGLPGSPGGERALLLSVVVAPTARDHRRQEQSGLLVELSELLRAGAAERAGRVLTDVELGALVDRRLDRLVEPVDGLYPAELRVGGRAVRERVDRCLGLPRPVVAARDEMLHAGAREPDLIDGPRRYPGVVDRRLASAVEAPIGHAETLDEARPSGPGVS